MNHESLRPIIGGESADFSLRLDAPWLVASFSEPVRACSWAVVGGGMVLTQHVAWLEVRNSDLPPWVDPARWFEGRLLERNLTGAVGLLTSRSIATYTDVAAEEGNAGARCVATVGLGNALRAGDSPGATRRLGTINVLVHASLALSECALLEANAIATEAKTAAMYDLRVRSLLSEGTATGTGTDCTVVTSPRPCAGSEGSPYSGKHTAIGAAVGRAVYHAVRRGAESWLAEQAAIRATEGCAT
jgi:adenosylcobinamide amidohydrolase